MKKWATIIGIGLAIFPIHNRFLTELAVNKGAVILFLPAIGFILVFVGLAMFIMRNWQKVKESGLGDKRIYIPLAIIAFAVALSGFAYNDFRTTVAIMGMGVGLFALYVVGRMMGKDMFLPLAVGACIASVGVIAYAAMYRVFPNGGFVFERNYDVVVGYVLLGVALLVNRWQWVLAGMALVTMFLTGSPEILLPLGIVGIAVLVRKDWSQRLVKVVVPLAVVLVVWFALGWGEQLYSYAWQIIRGEPTVPSDGVAQHDALTYRFVVIKDAMTNITPFGEGYKMTWETGSPNVHNVPLVLIEQMGYAGIVAALAWLWVTIYCLVKTKWKYVWMLIIGLSVFDHFIWSQLGLWWWAIVGVTTVGGLKSDLIFKGA